MKPILVLWTCRDLQEGKRIAAALLQKRLIACASMIPIVESMFHSSPFEETLMGIPGENKVDHVQECKIFLKTIERHFNSIRSYILENCSYKIPEILQVPIEQGHSPYLDWLQKVVAH